MGNIHRSAVAEQCLKQLLIDKNLCHEFESISFHEAKPITTEIVEKSHVVFVMDNLVLRNHDASLLKQFPKYSKKIKMFTELAGEKEDIDDCGPFAEDAILHRRVNEKIVRIIRDNFMFWAINNEKEKHEKIF